jgi:hypothetical protein
MSIQPPVDQFRDVGQRAIASLQNVAKEMGRNDAPSKEDFELLLRDLPRFELAALPRPFTVSLWKVFGESVLRSMIRAHLRESIGADIKQELHLYGMALSRWSEQVVRKLEALVNSYADAYRAQLQRLTGLHGESIDMQQLEADLSLLLNWSGNSASEFKTQQA